MPEDFLVNDHPTLDVFLRHPKVQNYLSHPAVNIRLVEPDGTYLFVGSNVHDLVGFSAAEFTQQNGWDSAHPDDRETIAEIAMQTMEGFAVQAILRARCKDDSYIWVRTQISPLDGSYVVLVQPWDAPEDGRPTWSTIPSFV